jgi:hypothetical protein
MNDLFRHLLVLISLAAVFGNFLTITSADSSKNDIVKGNLGEAKVLTLEKLKKDRSLKFTFHSADPLGLDAASDVKTKYCVISDHLNQCEGDEDISESEISSDDELGSALATVNDRQHSASTVLFPISMIFIS